MEDTGRVAGLGLELLNQSNYRIWKTCMESYLVGEDLWDVVSTNGVVTPANIIENAEAFKKWKQQNAKAEFVLKRSISHGIFEHIIGCESAREIWQTLDRLFNKKNEARLQMLENELAVTKQEGISISEYFLKVKNLCSEISLINPEERISEARKKRYIIRGLQPEYTLFITSIQGWAQQPSLEELENLLSSQESLAKQMATTSIKEEPKSALFVKKGDESTFSCSQVHDSGKGIITADNTIHKIQKEGTVVIDNNRGESITLNSVYHVPGIQKNLFSVANAVDAGNFVLFGPRDVKFLRNVKEIKADVVHTGSNYAEVTRLQEELSLRFDMKKLGELSNFLGLQIENLDKGIYVSQFSYAKRLIEKFGLIDGKKRSTPLDVNTRLRRDERTCLSDPRPFRTLVGSLIYLTITRPDIAFSVGMVSRYMQEPRKPHFEEAKKILKYVNSTLNLGLLYEKGVEFSLQGFADADFGGDLDDRRSTSGFVFLRGATSISWCSKKQSSVSLSTTEAEYKASAQAAQECMWLRRLFEDLHVPIDQSIPIHGDNLSAVKLTSNPVFHARTKHIELEHHFIREKVLDGIIDMVAVKSEDNIADIFTKTLPKGAFEDLRSKLGLVLRTSL
ncbi:hypothetical protein ZIOFF_002920 [Zingiber officinale]|uniref:Uncharacterized protein n=1 Tax=Zingiber officinale TaxID=94328 RepID=A0A8J5HX05_ZINOF|nr:hypothetical protein ZIOFF_002920 [Zingiber officinale]